jgi:hypothetical protein
LARVAPARATFIATLLAVPLPTMTMGCLLYTGPVNDPPAVEIESPTREPFRRTPTVLGARASDDEDPSEAIRLEWSQTRGPCPATPPAWVPGTGVVGSEYVLTLTDDLDVCVRVVATDSRGATGEQSLAFNGRNHLPRAVASYTAARSAAGKVRRYARVELSASASLDDDGDPLTPMWQVTGPDRAALSTSPCMTPPGRACFSAQTPGHYEISLVVSDGLASSTTERVAFDVDDDNPPCLVKSDPAPLLPLVVVRGGTRRAFEVQVVDDDGEPFPSVAGALGDPLFIWSAASEGNALERVAGENGPRLDVSEGLFHPPLRLGETARVRVEVLDKLRTEQRQQHLVPPPCADSEDSCYVDKCLRWATWKVQFSP